uniref:Uncharacterized protein n=1 Tax=Arundo donax TaxID=35708 RepID=A0A0A9GQ25_ARUDO
MSLFRNASSGQLSSDGVGSAPVKNGMSMTTPRRRTGWSWSAAGAPEKRTFMWCARTPPADSPATKTLLTSACSANHGSAALWSRSQSRTAAASSMAAGRRCSGARR